MIGIELSSFSCFCLPPPCTLFDCVRLVALVLPSDLVRSSSQMGCDRGTAHQGPTPTMCPSASASAPPGRPSVVHTAYDVFARSSSGRRRRRSIIARTALSFVPILLTFISSVSCGEYNNLLLLLFLFSPSSSSSAWVIALGDQLRSSGRKSTST